MKSKTARVAVMAIAIMGPLAACSDDGDTGEFPVGVYRLPGATETSIDQTMEFRSDDTFEVVFDGETMTDGTYSVDGDQLTFETDSLCKEISDAAESATYAWTQDGDLLTMTVEGEDLCTDRAELMRLGLEKSEG